jgi:hypothetical protein
MADGDPIVLGVSNDSVGATTINCDRTNSASFWVENDTGLAVYGMAGMAGVAGDSPDGNGVTGQSERGNGVVGDSGRGNGVLGHSYGPSIGAAGVRGESDTGPGVVGITQAESGRGVYGQASWPGRYGVMGRSDNGIGVSGLSVAAVGVSASGGQVGVVGTGLGSGIGVRAVAGSSDAVVCTSASGVGVRADSDSNDGVVGTSAAARGVVGTTLSPTGAGVHGVATSGVTTGVGVRASSLGGYGLLASCSTGVAGAFVGHVVVIGNLIAFGGIKSAAVPHPDGSHRLTYSVESPESWFEDFGRARLTGGRAEVGLDPDFAALVRTDDFHVFLTAEGETTGLYVGDRSETGFEVREQRGGDGEVAFSYRVVARRRDVDATRLAAVDLPEIPPEPEAVASPELPELPELPDQPALPPEWPPPKWPEREARRP